MNGNLLDTVRAFRERRVLVLGEAMLDSYLSGSAGRLSREAPVPIVSVGRREDAPGGAANAAANVRSLGGDVRFLSVVGDDDEAVRLRGSLERAGVGAGATLISAPGRETLAKQRIVADGQMLLRFDQGSVEPLGRDAEDELLGQLQRLHAWAEVVLVSDYGYGLLTDPVIDELCRLQDARPRSAVVDAKQPLRYRRLRPTAVKPNYEEAITLIGARRCSSAESRSDQIAARADDLLERCGATMAAVTLDSDGAVLVERGAAPYRTYSRPTSNDRAAGAGDTFAAAFALALATGASGPVASEAASAAAGVAVAKRGTTTCSAGELLDELAGWPKQVADTMSLARHLAEERRRGRRIVFTNGCFDILHRGHVTYLNRAKALGDVLVVALNSDDSVRRLKGDGRPINPLDDRAQVLAALSSVDHVVSFDEETPEALVRLLRPAIYCKGGDYTIDQLPEAPLVRALGGEIHLLPVIEERSTTRIIERISVAGAGGAGTGKQPLATSIGRAGQP